VNITIWLFWFCLISCNTLQQNKTGVSRRKMCERKWY